MHPPHPVFPPRDSGSFLFPMFSVGRTIACVRFFFGDFLHILMKSPPRWQPHQMGTKEAKEEDSTRLMGRNFFFSYVSIDSMARSILYYGASHLSRLHRAHVHRSTTLMKLNRNFYSVLTYRCGCFSLFLFLLSC